MSTPTLNETLQRFLPEFWEEVKALPREEVMRKACELYEIDPEVRHLWASDETQLAATIRAVEMED